MKNYLIIGASSGIGKALAEQLVLNGNVMATYNSNPASHSDIQYFYLDVLTDDIDLSQVPDELHGLAYCPGSINLKPFKRIKAADFTADFELQVNGAIKVIQQVLPKLLAAQGASIVLFSTVAVQQGFNFHSQVSASKGAIEGLTRALAAEFAPSIRVNAIAPSITDTPLASRLLGSEEKKQANADRHPMKQIGEASNIAGLAEFLLSDKSKWMTGQILKADGGMSSIRG